MENNNDNFNEDKNNLFGLEIDNYAKNTFYDMVKWSKFLAVLGFIGLGLMIAGGLYAIVAAGSYSSYSYYSRNSFGGIYGTMMFFIYIIIAALYFYPTFALLKYSTCMKTAVTTNNKAKFNEAITYLKNMFKYIGIVMIIILSVYALIFIFAIFAYMVRM
jgi:Family of unknown function (DUF5362)